MLSITWCVNQEATYFIIQNLHLYDFHAQIRDYTTELRKPELRKFNDNMHHQLLYTDICAVQAHFASLWAHALLYSPIDHYKHDKSSLLCLSSRHFLFLKTKIARIYRTLSILCFFHKNIEFTRFFTYHTILNER